MPKTTDGDTVICVGRESIEALATGEPVKVGDNEYLLAADSYDHPYKRIGQLEKAAAALLQEYDELQFSDHYPHHRALWEALRLALTRDSELME